MGFLKWALNNVGHYFEQEKERARQESGNGLSNAPGNVDMTKLPPKNRSGKCNVTKYLFWEVT